MKDRPSGGLPPLLRSPFVRFLLVGVLNTAFGYACFAVLLWTGLHYTLALLLATVVGVLFNFKTIGSLVFGSSDPALIWRFAAVYVLIYTLNVAALALLQWLGFAPLVAQSVLILPVAGASFLLSRRFVFRHG